jgi:hypothetical protein
MKIIKKSALVSILIFGMTTSVFASWWNPFTWNFFNKKVVQVQQVQQNTAPVKENISNQDAKVHEVSSISVLSPRGELVKVSFIPCDSVNTSSCFGDGAISLAETKNFLMWDLVSTKYDLNFGIVSQIGNTWPYTVAIDFGGKLYDMTEYDFFKNKIPELFFKNVKNNQ